MSSLTPSIGHQYTTRRNYNYGLEKHALGSASLSKIPRRLANEQEVIATALAANRPHVAKKFIKSDLTRLLKRLARTASTSLGQ